MTDEDIWLAQRLAIELMELESDDEELIKFENILDTEMALYDRGN